VRIEAGSAYREIRTATLARFKAEPELTGELLHPYRAVLEPTSITHVRQAVTKYNNLFEHCRREARDDACRQKRRGECFIEQEHRRPPGRLIS
jgi:hypothetical protein